MPQVKSAEARHITLSHPLYQASRAIVHILGRLLFNLKAVGLKNVPDDGRGVILAPNHASYLDPPIIGAVYTKYVTFLAKDYLYKSLLLGWWMRWVGTLPIKSDEKDFRTLRDLLRVLKDGRKIVVFPEGTRSPDGNLQEPESGAGFLAMKSKAWVVPIYLRGSYEAFPRNAKFLRFRPMTAYFGKAFIPAQEPSLLEAAEPYMAASRRIMDEIKKMKEAVERRPR